MTHHARKEMNDDGLTVYDVESGILAGNIKEEPMKTRTSKTRSPYGKIYWWSFAVVVFIWEIYLGSLNHVEFPITARLRAIISALILGGLPVLLVWLSNRLANRTSKR